jgi:hypothetical protein
VEVYDLAKCRLLDALFFYLKFSYRRDGKLSVNVDHSEVVTFQIEDFQVGHVFEDVFAQAVDFVVGEVEVFNGDGFVAGAVVRTLELIGGYFFG